jgi:2-polyprenyl-3-methyl-5-hydroxy-6-metoxy-1,4-benzoquinol methylase
MLEDSARDTRREQAAIRRLRCDVPRDPLEAARVSKEVPAGYEAIPCPLCGGARSDVVLRGGDRVLHEHVELTIVRCAECQLCYLNPRPLLWRLGAYYPPDYHAHRRQKGDVVGDKSSVHIRKLLLRKLYARPERKPTGVAGAFASGMLALRGSERLGAGLTVRGEGKLLDFGCGHGKLLRRMHAAGWAVVGLDFSEQAVNAVRSSGLEAYQGTLPHPEVPPSSFDAVVMEHALEHVPDPLHVLRAAREVLRPGGALLIHVPNFSAWEVQRFGEFAIQVDLPRHLLHFEPATLAKMLVAAGFVDVKTETRPRRGSVRKSIDLARRGGRPIPRWMNLPTIHRLICRRNRDTDRGSDLIATARRGPS